MAIGFMCSGTSVKGFDCKGARAAALALILGLPALAFASDISVVGVFPGRGAVLVVDTVGPQTVRLGQKLGGVTLVSVDKTGAVVDDGGRRRSIGLGQHIMGAAVPSPSAQVILRADESGHFVTDAAVNGSSFRFLVDTGATVVSISGKDARQMGIDFTKGTKSVAMTANGPVQVYRIKLDSVRMGAIELLNVDAMVVDGGGLTQPLLGMSFLNRLEMRRDGDSMTLKRRF